MVRKVEKVPPKMQEKKEDFSKYKEGFRKKVGKVLGAAALATVLSVGTLTSCAPRTTTPYPATRPTTTTTPSQTKEDVSVHKEKVLSHLGVIYYEGKLAKGSEIDQVYREFAQKIDGKGWTKVKEGKWAFSKYPWLVWVDSTRGTAIQYNAETSDANVLKILGKILVAQYSPKLDSFVIGTDRGILYVFTNIVDNKAGHKIGIFRIKKGQPPEKIFVGYWSQQR